ncbi:MAG TPA: TIGR01777 family protein [Desulfobulbaceae bacterium]|nr:TIGR01777 family protein [Desulfobulbaceae bacterium]
MHCLVTGGTGFVGRHLVRRLEQPVVAGRSVQKIKQLLGNVTPCQWDIRTPPERSVLDGVEAVFHLAGESVFSGRWNAARKQQILDSRLLGTRNLIAGLAGLDRPPAVLVCASAIGYYGARGAETLVETSPPGAGFLAQVCQAWEEEARQAEKLGTRVISVRIGLVLGSDGGALPRMLLPFRLGLGGRIGNGSQFMSWIHIDDLVGILLHAAAESTVRGPVNATAPQAVSNREFTTTLANILRRPAFLAVPAPLLKVALGEFADVLLGSQRVVPEKILNAGYTFAHPELKGALQHLLA